MKALAYIEGFGWFVTEHRALLSGPHTTELEAALSRLLLVKREYLLKRSESAHTERTTPEQGDGAGEAV